MITIAIFTVFIVYLIQLLGSLFFKLRFYTKQGLKVYLFFTLIGAFYYLKKGENKFGDP